MRAKPVKGARQQREQPQHRPRDVPDCAAHPEGGGEGLDELDQR